MGMEKRSALNFILRIKASLLHELLQAIANRAYAIGYDAAANGEQKNPESVRIDPLQVRKLQP